MSSIWSTPLKTIDNLLTLLLESWDAILLFFFILFIINRLPGMPHHDQVYVLSLKWKANWGFVTCYLRSKRSLYIKK